MKNIVKALFGASLFSVAVAAHAQFDVSINPYPIENRLITVVNVSVPNASWFQGNNNSVVADGRLVIQMRHKRTGRTSQLVRNFLIRKNGSRSGVGTFTASWSNDYESRPGSTLQIVIRRNGVQRVIPVAVR